MAEKASYKKILADIRAKKFAPVYLLSGEESYYIDEITESIRRNSISEEDEDFNLDIFFGADCAIADVVASARQYPTFAPRRLVILKEGQAMQRAKQQFEAFIPYLKNASKDTILVINYKGEAIPANSKLAKAVVQCGGVAAVFPKARDYELPDIIKEYCRDNSFSITEKAVKMLADHIGTDLSRLFGEIGKLYKSHDTQGRLEITPDLIESKIGISKDFNNFELLSAIYNRNYARSMQIAVNFGKNQKDNPPMVTAATLFNGFVKILRAHFSKDKSPSALRTKFGLYGSSATNEFFTAMRNYPPSRCFRIIHELRKFDCATKGNGSAQPPEELLKELVYKIFSC